MRNLAVVYELNSDCDYDLFFELLTALGGVPIHRYAWVLRDMSCTTEWLRRRLAKFVTRKDRIVVLELRASENLSFTTAR